MSLAERTAPNIHAERGDQKVDGVLVTDSAHGDGWRAIWSPEPPSPKPAPDGALRARGLRRALLMGLVSGVFAFLGWTWAAKGVAFAAAVFGVMALVRPRFISRLDDAVTSLGPPLSRALAWILLVPLFTLVVMPLGLLRSRKDPLGLTLDSGQRSYWRDRRMVKRSHERAY